MSFSAAVSGFLKLQQYRKNPSQALKEDFIDVIADSLPQLIFSVLLVLVGVGWLYYLLTARSIEEPLRSSNFIIRHYTSPNPPLEPTAIFRDK